MVRALVDDFAATPEVDVLALRDTRLARFLPPECHQRDVGDAADHVRAFAESAAQSDATLLVAPETDGILQDYCRRAVEAGARLISPSERAVAAAANKLRLAQFLSDAGVPTPLTRPLTAGQTLPSDFPYPAVVKPVRGAGSIGVRLVPTPSGADRPTEGERPSERVLQEFVDGVPASVAFLCGPSGRWPLVPCRQQLTGDGRFRFGGGTLPLPEPLAGRATRLADAALSHTLPRVVGYVGVDLVLGDEPDGARDVVIEINPRVTTSYVGLRVAARGNLAAAMLAVADDGQPNVRFSNDPLQFGADGAVRRMNKSCGELQMPLRLG